MRAAVSSVLPFLRYAVTPVAQNVWLSIFVVISAARARRWIIALTMQDNLEHERTSTGGESAALIEKPFGLRQGDINRSNREIGKPKQEQAQPRPDRAFGNQTTLAANKDAARGQGKT